MSLTELFKPGAGTNAGSPDLPDMAGPSGMPLGSIPGSIPADYRRVGQSLTEFLYRIAVLWVRDARIELQNLHSAAVLRIIIRRQFGAIPLERIQADPAQDGGRPVTKSGGGHACAAAQELP